MADLLIELVSEEIPARMQARAVEDLKRLVTDGLVDAGLTYGTAAGFVTPRRLALAVTGLPASSPTLREERKGPRVDAPVKALEGFLRATGLTKKQLEKRDTDKGEVWFATVETTGRPAAVIVAEVAEKIIRTFPWPKSMRWGDGNLRWVRPLHSILCILHDESGAEVVPLEVDEIQASDSTSGHRFMAPDRFAVTSFEDYEAKLKTAKVILSAEDRAQHILHEAESLAFAHGLELVEDRGLLAELAGLVEWPIVLMGDIESTFLDLPPEVLRTSMKEHQKFFSLRSPKTGRIEKFVTVANRETADNGATILAGNRKVLAARLSDAKFFWENDLRVAKAGMESWIDSLAKVTFHGRLGSQKERIERIEVLAAEIAPSVNADPELAKQAAHVAKADLSSEMVYEFPELQGTMGRYYAEVAGFPPEVAAAADQHYAPLGPNDEVPTAPVSVAVALADKIHTLTGFWAIDEKPTGSKDPFALRRAALGVIRILLANDIRLNLTRFIDAELLKHEINDNLDTAEERDLFLLERMVDRIGKHGVLGAAWRAIKEELRDEEESFEPEEGKWLTRLMSSIPATRDDLLTFFHDRLKVHLRDRGVRHGVIDACLAMSNADDLTLLVRRAEALGEALQTDDGENLIQGFRRANNILIQAEEKDGVEYSFGPDPKFAETDEERALFVALDAADVRIAPAMKAEDFRTAMHAMADLRAPIDAFFEAVQVNTDNQTLRRNRLNLLHRIRQICLSVADLTRIEG